jgi:3-deoxy-D-manno-octulosonate 8-phosphate phosphatase (KDO 8-P phosphatase)
MTAVKTPSPAQAARIRLLVLDVDGVLTDGRIHYDPDGREAKVFDVKDGYGIKQITSAGITVAVISGRKSRPVKVRMAELGIQHVRLGQDDKLAALTEITRHLDIPLSEVACMGDDLPDLPMMEAAALGIAVADAHPAIVEKSDWCTRLGGGRGAVREVCDFLVAAQKDGPG